VEKYLVVFRMSSRCAQPQVHLVILCFVDRASLYDLFQMKPTGCTLLLSIFISTSLHVSGKYVPIIRRTYAAVCLVWSAAADQTVVLCVLLLVVLRVLL